MAFRKLGQKLKLNSKNEKSIFYGITVNVLLLGLTSLLMDVSGEIITAILPLFLASLGAGAVVIGLVGGISDSVVSIFKVLSGYWSDKTGKRKPFVLFGYTFSSLSRFFIAISTTWPMILFFRPMERLGKGVRDPPRDALLAETTMRKVHGRVFGFHQALDNAGAVIGSALAFIFLLIGLKFRLALMIAAIIAITSIIPLFAVKEKRKLVKKITLKVGLKGLSKRFKIFLIIVTLFALGNFSYMFFILKAQTVFNNLTTPLLLFFIHNIFYVVFTIPGGILSDKIGRKKVLIVGYFLFALAFLGFALISSTFTQFLIIFSLYGLAKALVESNQRALASDLASKELGTALGTFHMAIGLAALPAGLIAGALWESINTSAPFFYGAVVSFAAALWFYIDRKIKI